uniref:bifunctional protein-disulfide isomerase/oxidoreductase DsbC n=1 Tax=Thaumasiovibrio occultus TaxID=1891184 RepID=UPI000B358AD6|nr:bifunctional protein-disulfide isomerase/oxidoreductase DsbC [Thaumasiovibrio occultus]
MHSIGKQLSLGALTLAMLAANAVAAEIPAKLAENAAGLDIEIRDAKAAPLAGMLELETNRGIFYATEDGRYLMAGQLLDLESKTNLTEQSQNAINRRLIESAEDSMIVYPAKDEKYVVTVFTDTSCGYCQKLHDEMADYNDAGITVRYLAFPRGGVNSATFGQMSAIWCADDQLAAMDLGKAGNFNQTSQECADTVGQHYAMGVEIGIRGTPAMVLEDGSMIPGYRPAAALLADLEAKAQ